MRGLAIRSCLCRIDNCNSDNYVKAYVAFYVLICALRWNVGTDSMVYAKFFSLGATENLKENGELLFWGVTQASSSMGLHFTLGLALCAFLQFFAITKALEGCRYVLITLPLVMFGSRYFLDLNNAVRQMIVASMFVYASRFIVDKKPWRYAAFILLGSTIHQSCYMLIPFYFISGRLALANKRVLMLSIFTCCFFAGQTPAFQSFVGYGESLAHMSGYDIYADRVGAMLRQGKTAESLSFGPMMLSYLMTAYFLIWFGPWLKKQYADKIPYFHLWYNLAFFYACAYFLICNISHIFIRPVMYFELFQMVMVAMLLYALWSKRSKYHQVCFLTFLCVLWTNTFWDVKKAYNLPRESSTYKVFFLHMDEVKRFTTR